eukprot:GHVQ01026104.1.p1 GENE.GHVQ01026104.1~~GHVQ01026104.1.p1  ORF type:complete len:1466 (-),score=283.66 GHVQ01026104.1:55-4290(-)
MTNININNKTNQWHSNLINTDQSLSPRQLMLKLTTVQPLTPQLYSLHSSDGISPPVSKAPRLSTHDDNVYDDAVGRLGTGVTENIGGGQDGRRSRCRGKNLIKRKASVPAGQLHAEVGEYDLIAPLPTVEMMKQADRLKLIETTPNVSSRPVNDNERNVLQINEDWFRSIMQFWTSTLPVSDGTTSTRISNAEAVETGIADLYICKTLHTHLGLVVEATKQGSDKRRIALHQAYGIQWIFLLGRVPQEKKLLRADMAGRNVFESIERTDMCQIAEMFLGGVLQDEAFDMSKDGHLVKQLRGVFYEPDPTREEASSDEGNDRGIRWAKMLSNEGREVCRQVVEKVTMVIDALIDELDWNVNVADDFNSYVSRPFINSRVEVGMDALVWEFIRETAGSVIPSDVFKKAEEQQLFSWSYGFRILAHKCSKKTNGFVKKRDARLHQLQPYTDHIDDLLRHFRPLVMKAMLLLLSIRSLQKACIVGSGLLVQAEEVYSADSTKRWVEAQIQASPIGDIELMKHVWMQQIMPYLKLSEDMIKPGFQYMKRAQHVLQIRVRDKEKEGSKLNEEGKGCMKWTAVKQKRTRRRSETARRGQEPVVWKITQSPHNTGEPDGQSRDTVNMVWSRAIAQLQLTTTTRAAPRHVQHQHHHHGAGVAHNHHPPISPATVADLFICKALHTKLGLTARVNHRFMQEGMEVVPGVSAVVRLAEVSGEADRLLGLAGRHWFGCVEAAEMCQIAEMFVFGVLQHEAFDMSKEDHMVKLVKDSLLVTKNDSRTEGILQYAMHIITELMIDMHWNACLAKDDYSSDFDAISFINGHVHERTNEVLSKFLIDAAAAVVHNGLPSDVHVAAGSLPSAKDFLLLFHKAYALLSVDDDDPAAASAAAASAATASASVEADTAKQTIQHTLKLVVGHFRADVIKAILLWMLFTAIGAVMPAVLKPLFDDSPLGHTALTNHPWIQTVLVYLRLRSESSVSRKVSEEGRLILGQLEDQAIAAEWAATQKRKRKRTKEAMWTRVKYMTCKDDTAIQPVVWKTIRSFEEHQRWVYDTWTTAVKERCVPHPRAVNSIWVSDHPYAISLPSISGETVTDLFISLTLERHLGMIAQSQGPLPGMTAIFLLGEVSAEAAKSLGLSGNNLLASLERAEICQVAEMFLGGVLQDEGFDKSKEGGGALVTKAIRSSSNAASLDEVLQRIVQLIDNLMDGWREEVDERGGRVSSDSRASSTDVSTTDVCSSSFINVHVQDRMNHLISTAVLDAARALYPDQCVRTNSAAINLPTSYDFRSLSHKAYELLTAADVAEAAAAAVSKQTGLDALGPVVGHFRADLIKAILLWMACRAIGTVVPPLRKRIFELSPLGQTALTKHSLIQKVVAYLRVRSKIFVSGQVRDSDSDMVAVTASIDDTAGGCYSQHR